MTLARPATTLAPDDLAYLRRAIALAHQARAQGNRPFGAVLVDGRGEVLGEAGNTQFTARDLTAHAELNLLRELPADIDPARLAGATLYASAEPCPMCAGALFWSGVGRLVYGLSSARFYSLEGDSPFQLHVGVRQVLQGGKRPIQIEGPVLEEEALRPFDGFWS
jgi:tRNA(Arg) A34 adenosine deaminase TadA